MNLAHIHLLITHLPIFGSILGGLVLAYGLYCKSTPTITASYFVFIISSLGAGVSYLTGGSAEELVEKIQGISDDRIHEHAKSSFFALISLILLGINAIIGIIFNIKNLNKARMIAQIALIISLISFAIIVRVGYLGGKIRHTEIYDTELSPPNIEQQQNVQ